jgi:CDP-diacylglycerol--glycerol-3-phosphate 3-phosphatidyltransferase
MTRHIPNLLTASRFLMAIGFFVVLGFYDVRTAAGPGWPVLDVALAIFLVAALTDVVDGYLARRLGHMTTFGRIADPFVDKIIVCGALGYLIGGQFLAPASDGGLRNLTGWEAWMVVVILARELLVTGMRSFSEVHRIPFAATLSGKVKMFVQCFAISWSLFYVAHWADGPDWTRYVRDGLIWTTTLVTGVSGLVYVQRAYVLLRLPPD